MENITKGINYIADVEENETGWLASYPYENVAVFDFYCVLAETELHHIIENGDLIYSYAADYDGISPNHSGDDHPNSLGNQKSTNEFIPLINYYYNKMEGILRFL